MTIMNKQIFELVSENLSGLGSSMGTEHTKVNWRKFFNTLDAAKKSAENEYGQKIEWSANKGPMLNFKPVDLLCSGDLLYVRYHINTVKCCE